jgi:hypothetical protein
VKRRIKKANVDNFYVLNHALFIEKIVKKCSADKQSLKSQINKIILFINHWKLTLYDLFFSKY